MLRIIETVEEFGSPHKSIKKIERSGMKERLSQKGNIILNKKIQGSILNRTRKKRISQRIVTSFSITESTIGTIILTIPIPKTSKVKQETGRKKMKVERTEGLGKKETTKFYLVFRSSE